MTELPAPAIHAPWKEADRQHEAMLFGLWLFLVTEIMFFGGLFLLYAHARAFDWASFQEGARAANPWFGTANTIVLLTSGLTATVGERATKAGWRRLGVAGFAVTIALGLTFLVVKAFEYRADLAENLFPGGEGFRFHSAGASEFWNFYWTITAVHAIHLAIGLGLVARLLLLARKGELVRRRMGAEVTTVYWGLVDIMWVLIYPLIYLVGR